jgi:hypothetical protein
MHRIPVIIMTAAAGAAAVLAAVVPAARAAGTTDGGTKSDCGASGYPWGYDIACQSGSAIPGKTATAPARPAGPPTVPCVLYPIAGNPGHMLQVCPTGLNNGRYLLPLPLATTSIVGVAAPRPQVTPQQLLAWAQDELILPLPGIATAPPRGSQGLVGLPEWFWVNPAQWHPQTARVAAGGVWAQVTATPQALQIQPGDGAPGTGVTCRGPGTPYNPGLPAAAQHSNCTYTYSQSSDGLPGNAYQVRVTMTWQATWQGSGGAGGALPELGRTAGLTLPVAEAQAIISATPGT